MESCHSTPDRVKGHTKYLGDIDNFLLSTLHRFRGKLYSKRTLLGRNKHCKKYIVHFRVSDCVDSFLLSFGMPGKGQIQTSLVSEPLVHKQVRCFSEELGKGCFDIE